MKKIVNGFSYVMGFTLLAFSLFGCKDDVNDEENLLKKDYFFIENATYVNKSLPSGTGDLIDDFQVGKNVINGGSTIMKFTSTKELTSANIGIKGKDGYYESSLSQTKSTQGTQAVYEYQIIIYLSQNLSEGFAFSISVVSTDGTMSLIINSEIVNVVEVGTGKLQVSLFWDQMDDVDLHLYEPDGTHIYYNHKSSEDDEGNIIGELDLDSNALCGIDGKNNENIVYKDRVKPGKYTVAVDLYLKCTSSGTKGSEYSVTVNYNGNPLIISDKQVGKFGDSEAYSAEYVIIGEFTIGNSSKSVLSEDDIIKSLVDIEKKRK